MKEFDVEPRMQYVAPFTPVHWVMGGMSCSMGVSCGASFWGNCVAIGIDPRCLDCGDFRDQLEGCIAT